MELHKDWKVFVPLFLFYLGIIFCCSTDKMVGDEVRYFDYTANMLNGFYADAENPSIRNGPAYPILLLPFAYLGVSFFYAKLLNALFVFIGIYWFYRTLLLYGVSRKIAIGASYLLGLYPPMLKWLFLLYTEPLVFAMMCGILYVGTVYLRAQQFDWKLWGTCVGLLGGLALTKVIFGTVYLVALLLSLAGLAFYRTSAYRRTILGVLGGLICFSPFWIYTYSVTGKVMYSGTQGGEILYFRATPFEGEYGNWFSASAVYEENPQNNPDENLVSMEKLIVNHRPFYNEIAKMSHIQRDSAFKSKAIEYMKAHPVKYVQNTIANVGRIFFQYPFSYRTHSLSTFGYLLPNGFLLFALLLCLVPAMLRWRQFPFELKALLLMGGIFLGGLILLGGRGRHLIACVPVLWLFVLYVATQVVKVELRPKL